MDTGKAFTNVRVPEHRLRELDQSKVDLLAQSMDEIGLQSPITVFTTGEYNTDCVLVAGLHRLEAAKKLGWEEIDCIFTDLSETDRELWEIDENLVRAELTTEQKREHLRRRKEVWERRKAEENNGASCAETKREPGRPKGFAADTAEKTGMSKSQINRLLAEPKPKPNLVVIENESPEDAKARWLQQGLGWWARGESEWREEFLDKIDTPVFDSAARE